MKSKKHGCIYRYKINNFCQMNGSLSVVKFYCYKLNINKLIICKGTYKSICGYERKRGLLNLSTLISILNMSTIFDANDSKLIFTILIIMN